MIVVRWGKEVDKDVRDLEMLFSDHEEADKFYEHLVESEGTTYTMMEEIKDNG